MPKLIDLRKQKVKIAERYRIKCSVMTREGLISGGYVKVQDLSGKIVTVLRVNKKLITVALPSAKKVSVFNIVTKGPFRVMPIFAQKIRS